MRKEQFAQQQDDIAQVARYDSRTRKFILTIAAVSAATGFLVTQILHNERQAKKEEEIEITNQVKEILLEDAGVITEQVFQERVNAQGAIHKTEFVDTLAYVIDATKVDVLHDMNKRNRIVRDALDEILQEADTILFPNGTTPSEYVIAADKLQMQ